MNWSDCAEPCYVRGLLDRAIGRFHTGRDFGLLLPGKPGEPNSTPQHGSVGERAIAHRLAVHIEAELIDSCITKNFPEVVVDCEYNRHRGAVKSFRIQKELRKRVVKARRAVRDDPVRDGWYVFSIFPDIIVHQRESDTKNLLVVELKRSSNTIDPDYDRLKLQLFTTSRDYGYGYALGVALVVQENTDPSNRCIKIVAEYVDGKMQKA
jgi:hypothetical protein